MFITSSTCMYIARLNKLGGDPNTTTTYSTRFDRNDIGCIKIGNSADFAIYDLSNLSLAGAVDDPIGSLVFCGPLNTKWTICNGKIISESNNITNLELGKTIDIHNTLSKNLLNK